jgi:tetratricopeptide (TPR) repeat protein
MILLYSRRCLEIIITDLCECELKRPRKTEPLQGIIDKLNKEGKVPPHIIVSMHGLNSLSTFGTHPKDFDPEQVKPVLVNLDVIIKWYLKYKQIVAIGNANIEKEKVQLKKEPPPEVVIKKRKVVHRESGNLNRNKLLLGAVVLAILIFAAIILYPKIFKPSTLEKLRSSGNKIVVAVMPFQNMTNDTVWNVWQDGIQNELITSLTNSEELKVRQTESINSLIQSKGLTNYASITPSVARTISQNLDANLFIYGSIKQAGATIRVNAQLIDSKTEEVVKSFLIEGVYREENIFHLIDSLSVMVKNFLIISELKKDLPLNFKDDVYAGSPEAFRYFIYGRNAYYIYDYPTARNWLLQSISIDSNYIDAILQLSLAYRNQFIFDQITKSYGNEFYFDQAKKWCLKAYEKRNKMPPQQKIKTNRIYAMYFETPQEEIKYLKQLLNFDDQNPNVYYSLGSSYYDLHQFDKAIPEYEKALEIYKKWGVKPDWIFNYTYLGESYHNAKMYKEEEKLYKKAEQNFPDDPNLVFNQLVLSCVVGDTIAVKELTEKGTSLMKSLSMSEASIASMTAWAYSKAGALDKAEEYYRRALSLEPESPVRLNDLAYFLIDNELDINEGLKQVNKALELRPDYYDYLHTKGWGLYRQGKYQEALDILQRSWDLRREKAIYDHEAYIHLEAAKKAVGNQNKN